MRGNEFKPLFDMIDLVKILFIVAVICFPLAIWKIIDLIKLVLK